MKILVYGAGPLGSYFAARLAQAENEVTILARGRRFTHLRRRSIELQPFEGGELTRVRVHPMERLGPLDEFDLVMVVLGKNYLKGVLPFLVANISTPNVLFVGNNVAGPGEMIRLLGTERVLLGFPVMSAAMEDQVVRHLGEHAPRIVMGELNGEVTERIQEIRSVLEGAGIEVELNGNMDGYLKYHAALILPLAHAYDRAGNDVKALARSRDVPLMIRAVRESFAVLREQGYDEVPESLRRLERLPLIVLTPLVRRILGRKEMVHVFTHAEAMEKEIEVLEEEFQELVASTSIETPSLDELRKPLDTE